MKIPVIDKGFLISYSIIGLGAIVLYGVFGGVTWLIGELIAEQFPVGAWHPRGVILGGLISIVIVGCIMITLPFIHALAIKIKNKMHL